MRRSRGQSNSARAAVLAISMAAAAGAAYLASSKEKPATAEVVVRQLPTVEVLVAKADIGAEDLEQHVRGSPLADFKRPRQFHFLEAIPRNATNKIMRKALLEKLLQR